MKYLRALRFGFGVFALSTSISYSAETINVGDYFHGTKVMAEKLATWSMEQTPHGNTLICPLGPTQLLSTLHQALQSPTFDENAQQQAEIEALLGHQIQAEGIQAFHEAIPEDKTKSSYTFLNHQYIFPREGRIKSETLDALSQLGSGIVPLDFSQSGKAADIINGIVAKDTRDLIQNMVSAEDFNDLTRAVFLSTLYVKANWVSRFYEIPLNFGSEGNKKPVTGLRGIQWTCFSETESDWMVAVRGEKWIYFMIKMSKTDQVTPITAADFELWQKTNELQYTDLTIPAFTIENLVDLSGLLGDKLPTVLGKEAELKTILTDEPLAVDKFFQKNKLIVSKKGLEGASVTMMGAVPACYVPRPEITKTIVVDKPFSYLISHGIGKNPETGGSAHFLHLFAGNVWDIA